MGIFAGKKGLIFGVADEKSLAWGVAQALHAEGAELGFNYNRQREGVEALAASLDSRFIEQCNVADDEAIDTGSLSQEMQDYVKTARVVLGQSLYSDSWLEL